MIYPQICSTCEHRFDHERPASQYAEDPPCERCGGETGQDWQAKKFPLVFKGDGFYSNRPQVVVKDARTDPETGERLPREIDVRPRQRSL